MPRIRRLRTGAILLVLSTAACSGGTAADIGATYLNDGIWDGQQVIAPDWVTASATPYAGNMWTNHVLRPIPPDDNTWGRRGYAYAWWTHEFRKSGHTVPAFDAWGWGGQVIAVLPEHDAVAVFTGAHYNAASSPAKILGAHVIPALLIADAAG